MGGRNLRGAAPARSLKTAAGAQHSVYIQSCVPACTQGTLRSLCREPTPCDFLYHCCNNTRASANGCGTAASVFVVLLPIPISHTTRRVPIRITRVCVKFCCDVCVMCTPHVLSDWSRGPLFFRFFLRTPTETRRRCRAKAPSASGQPQQGRVRGQG